MPEPFQRDFGVWKVNVWHLFLKSSFLKKHQLSSWVESLQLSTLGAFTFCWCFFKSVLVVTVRGWGKKPDPWWVYIYMGKTMKNLFCVSNFFWCFHGCEDDEFEDWTPLDIFWILMDESPDLRMWSNGRNRKIRSMHVWSRASWVEPYRFDGFFGGPNKIIYQLTASSPMNMWVFSWLASTLGWKPPKWRFGKLRSFSKRWFLHNTGCDMSWFLLSWKWLHQNSQKWLHPPSGFHRSKNRPF